LAYPTLTSEGTGAAPRLIFESTNGDFFGEAENASVVTFRVVASGLCSLYGRAVGFAEGCLILRGNCELFGAAPASRAGSASEYKRWQKDWLMQA